MAIGDIGGPSTGFVVTCLTPAAGAVDIRKGDALKLTANYTVTNVTSAEDILFGQALSDATENNLAIAVMVRGIAVFDYEGAAPTVNGKAGVAAAATDGKVKTPASGDGRGINLKVDTGASRVHVML